MTAFCFRVMALLALAWSALATAQGSGAPHIAASLVAESRVPRAGSRIDLAIAFRPAPTWHGYWQNPGDAGTETLAAWTLPAGAKAGSLRYPVPGTLLVGGIMNHVYEAPYALLASFDVPKGLAAGTKLPLRVKLDWLACTREICVPERATLALDLTVGNGAPDAAARADFDRWRTALPRPLAAPARFERRGGALRLAVPLPASARVDAPWFFALADDAVEMAAPQTITRSGDTLVVETKAGRGTPDRIAGVLRIGPERGLTLTALPGAVPAAGMATREGEGGGSGPGLLLALAGAILGGLILNVMPCVFPILSLKALSLAKAGGDGGAARRDALAYTAGAVVACVALGAVLLGLRAGGAAAGWAFQLTDPRMIAALLLLSLAIGLNLAGLFELPSLGGGLAARGGGFATGALAAFVATPCTGPFMATALGAALILPWVQALAVFAGLGLGLALPFLALGFVPAFRRRLPRPGPWMATLRHILAVPMLLTALALAWLLGRLAGVDGMATGLAAALLLGIGLWWVGARGLGARAWWPLVPALAGAAALIVAMPRAAPAAAAAVAAGGSEPFSEARLAALTAAGTPVFVYFTADWCLTCKVNEKAAIERASVRDAFAAKGIKVLVGDWTDGDAAIGRFLSGQGRSGVPLYLFYAPGQAPQVLPQVLTPGLLTALAT